MIATSGSNNTIAKGYQSVSVNPANIAFDEGLSIIISGGMVIPDNFTI